MTQTESVLRKKLGGRRVGRAPVKGVEIIGENFAKLLDERMRHLLRTIVGGILLEAEILKMQQVLEEIAVPAMIGILPVRGSKNSALVNLSGDLVYHVVDLRMGGDPEDAPIPTARSITAIDSALCEDFVVAMIEAFESALELHLGAGVKGKMSFSHFEQHVTMVRIAPEHSDVLRLRLSLDIGEAARSGEFDLVLPLSVLDAYKASAQPEAALEEPDKADLWSEHMARAAAQAPVRVRSVLKRLRLTVGQIEDLAPGVVIPLDEKCREDVELAFESDGKQLARGRLGAADGRKAVKLTVPPDPVLQSRLRELIEVSGPMQ
ncbi:FliM/FliN family flagellar motor switch protein [Oceanicella actignis]|uniref:Flagellar motor switch protein FliM n=1 Tax=Oceanicella actignis TaxID=1189325 RepID=A0A1M7T5I8_9RHOB|nr:FliM/FliN family flagellar motor switch protein [Oceanicella actignis]TYO84866.1 flagellar motor switch protein FliM [Oceanicella actignis]SET43441.1 flagellar motor switch protein FliM [Oceanicella actignis]SHN65989.1 flagellar motor switch protein FliM [Oceanicella actignis]